MKPKKKNGFFTFLCIFCPGAAEMYVGYLKNGLTLMGAFALSIVLLGTTEFGAFAATTALIWFYGFFHAINVSKMDEASIAEHEDMYIWEEFLGDRVAKVSSAKMRGIMAAVLIIVGLGMLWNYVSEIIVRLIPDYYWEFLYPIIYKIPNIAVAIALIFGGLALIRGKKKQMEVSTVEAQVVNSSSFIEQKDSKEA